MYRPCAKCRDDALISIAETLQKAARSWLPAILVMTIGTGCTQLPNEHIPIANIESSLASIEEDVSNTQTAIENANKQAQQDDAALSQELASLSRALTQLDANMQEVCKAVAVPVPQAKPADCPPSSAPIVMADDDKLILGEVENVTVIDPVFQIVARMDTGASSSSIHAKNLVTFERDGNDWVRFEITSTDGSVKVEKAVEKFVRVYQQADKAGSRRPVIELRIRLGNIQGTFEFTLADRSHLEHSMILGRNFLTDIALVDVSQQFLQPVTSE